MISWRRDHFLPPAAAARLSHRRHQRGQALPIAAIFSTLLLGAVALGTDLSLASHYHRNLQNAADAGALAGARDLGTSNGGKANQNDRTTAATDALRVVYDHMGWGSAGTTWANGVISAHSGTCDDSGTHCDVTTTGPGSGANTTVTVNVPPLHAYNNLYNESSPGQPWGYIEVTVSDQHPTFFAGVIGFTKQTEGGHAIGYHYPPSQAFGFALYSNTTVSGGNTDNVISGNVYSYRNLTPQSSGKADFCADTDPTGNLGHLVVGWPQSSPYPSPDPAAGAPFQYLVTKIQNVSSCSPAAGGDAVSQTAPLGNCASLVVQGVTMSTVQDPGSLACMANPPLLPPDLQGPSLSGNVVYYNGSGLASGQSVLTVTSPLSPGLYYITHNPNCIAPGCTDVVIDGSAPANCTAPYSPTYSTCLLGVTFWLDQGATIGVTGKQTAIITPYLPSGSSDPNDGRYAVYAPIGSAGGVYLSKNGTLLGMTGTVYLPSGTFSMDTNSAVSIQGQAIVNNWSGQSGYHGQPQITYDPRYVAGQREVLQLVE